MKSRILLFIILCTPLFLFSNTNPIVWELKKSSNGIEIYTRKIDGSNFKEYKVQSFINAPINLILKKLISAAEYSENYDSGVSYFIREKPNGERVYYARQKMPWPLKDRDAVSTIKITRLSDSKIKITIKATTRELPEKDNVIRIGQINGHWLLEDLGDTVKVVQQLHLDPKGNIPAILSNSLLTRGPYKAFSKLNERILDL